jgi:hypothetical protein
MPRDTSAQRASFVRLLHLLLEDEAIAQAFGDAAQALAADTVRPRPLRTKAVHIARGVWVLGKPSRVGMLTGPRVQPCACLSESRQRHRRALQGEGSEAQTAAPTEPAGRGWSGVGRMLAALLQCTAYRAARAEGPGRAWGGCHTQ